MLEDPSLTRNLLVLPDGTVSFPYIGTLHVAGETIDRIRSEIQAGIAPQFSIKPTVIVTVANVGKTVGDGGSVAGGSSLPVYLMGEVTKAGRFDVSRGTTLLQAVAEAGGVTKFAAERRIELHRRAAGGKDQIYTFSIEGRAAARGSATISADTELQPGDVIIVPTKRLFE